MLMCTAKGSLGHLGTRQWVTPRQWDSIIGHSSKNMHSHHICRWSKIDTSVTFSLGFVAGLTGWKLVKEGTQRRLETYDAVQVALALLKMNSISY